MSNKLFLVGLATVATLVTSLVNVVGSQAQVAVGGNTFSTGTNPGGTQSGTASTSAAIGKESRSSSFSDATTRGSDATDASTTANASTDKLTARGSSGTGLNLGRFGIIGSDSDPDQSSSGARASAGNNGVGTTFTNAGSAALSIPGLSQATAVGNFGSVGF
jgi:hypothetical protein